MYIMYNIFEDKFVLILFWILTYFSVLVCSPFVADAYNLFDVKSDL